MINEEAIEQLKEIPLPEGLSIPYMRRIYTAIDLAIKALEQQPCEDCISRLIVQEEISKSIALKENPHQMYKRIQAIPSVTPKAENEEQYKADLQGAYDCGYNCGYTDAMSDIYERGDSE